MPALPWKVSQAPDADTDYVVMCSRLPLCRYRFVPRFVRDTLAIRRQLRSAPGLIGYALDAHLLRKTFWTLSAWKDDPSLRAFVEEEPHRTVMARIRPLMSKPAFVFSTMSGRDLPAKWDDARARLDAQEQH